MDKIKKIILEIIFYFFSTFQKRTVGGFVNQLIKKIRPEWSTFFKYFYKICLPIYLIETAFDTFANRADPDQTALIRAAWPESALFAYENLIRYDPTLVDLTSNFFVQYTQTWIFIYISIHSGWSLAWIFMVESCHIWPKVQVWKISSNF